MTKCRSGTAIIPSSCQSTDNKYNNATEADISSAQCNTNKTGKVYIEKENQTKKPNVAELSKEITKQYAKE